MSAEEDVDTTRTAVKTYIPTYQRDTWDEDADEMDMSRSEFVRSMVQAGRRGFELDGNEESPREDRDSDTEGSESPESSQEAVEHPFETRILSALSRAEYLSWEELVEAVTTDIEEQLETTLQELQADNVVRYSGPNGGYTIDQ